jgi:hypothetical protein
VSAKLSIFCHHRCIRKIINSLPLRRKLLRNFLLRVRSNKNTGSSYKFTMKTREMALASARIKPSHLIFVREHGVHAGPKDYFVVVVVICG